MNNQITFCKNKKIVIFTKDNNEVSILQDDGYLLFNKKQYKVYNLSTVIITE